MEEQYEQGENMGGSPPQNVMGTPPAGAPPPQPVQAYPQQTYTPVPAPPKRSFFESSASGGMLITILVIGVLLLMLGMILIHAAPSVTNYGSALPSSEKMRDDEALQNSIVIWGKILTDLGIAALSAFLLIGSLVRKETELKLRIGMFTLAAILIVVTWIRIAP